jgi:hypothetical protein
MVERDKDGYLRVREGGDFDARAGFAGGSLIGMLVGVLRADRFVAGLGRRSRDRSAV